MVTLYAVGAFCKTITCRCCNSHITLHHQSLFLRRKSAPHIQCLRGIHNNIVFFFIKDNHVARAQMKDIDTQKPTVTKKRNTKSLTKTQIFSKRWVSHLKWIRWLGIGDGIVIRVSFNHISGEMEIGQILH